MKQTIILIALIAINPTSYAAIDWQLKKNTEGIKVYTGSNPNTNIKAVRAVFTINASLSQLTAVLMDTKADERWVYSTKQSYLIKQVSNNDRLYYSEVGMPWPLSNRDVVVEMNITQQPTTKVVIISGCTYN